ncbi:MAG: type II toxin-antitoxin system RelE/ParE family toxin [Alphaproteobacteria bacterium]|nr:type II toxin-antitoxin system RelE/ParE family toxin [Alphaproteobacteria bacterium]
MALKLSDLALQDLEDIRRYTVESWGRDQWLKYYQGMIATFESIQTDPNRGRNRDLFYDGMLSRNYERHVIFYMAIEKANDDPVILRIVHQRRNLPALVYYEDLDQS